jgi:hypothetical protein
MTKRQAKTPTMRKVILKCVDANGNPAPDEALAEMAEEREYSTLGRQLPEKMIQRVMNRPNYLDYQAVITLILKQPKDGPAGGNYSEMKALAEMQDLVADAQGSESFICTEIQWKDLCDRCEKFSWSQLTVQIREFVESVLDSEQIEMREAEGDVVPLDNIAEK